MKHETLHQLPVIIIGAGPIGLAAAAHLAAREASFLVLEKGASAGSHVREWGHVRMFSPWKYNVDPVAKRLLLADGWMEPDPEALPTGDELCERLLEPLADLPWIARWTRYRVEVLAVTRVGADRLKSAGRGTRPWRLRVRDADGVEQNLEARAVLDSSGTWGNPKPLGADGLAAIGERDARESIHYGMPSLTRDQGRYAGKRVAVVGAGDSAFNVLIELSDLAGREPGTEIHWVVRGELPSFGGGEADQLPQRGELGSSVRGLVARRGLHVHPNFHVARVTRGSSGLRLASDESREIEVDEIVGVTGFRPELEMLREVRLDLDQATEAPTALGPLIDPNVHCCGTVRPHGVDELMQPDDGFFVVGMKSYGRAPTFLLLTGYEQVRSVVAALSGDLRSAREVSLVLPETGVCSGGFVADPSPSKSACCDGAAAVI